ncbi:hypothetical protein THAOC_26331 [Thalassiosira oceanica]|uniref:Uncharacterized protein n=1 Tax=Thalassiosira oceanica TaxID=159749 RepID=K0RP95_THAOC|nr:hypothetical protein THAOC_26331 [Thalassiosira oceanica]|eukprot:EJK54109.1 hypothetical protein THAOC_26331 [Thalassiosira oceanica]
MSHGWARVRLLTRSPEIERELPGSLPFSELYAQVTPTMFELDTSVMHSKFTFTVSGYYESGCNPVMERIRKPYSAPTVVLRLPRDEFDFHPGRHEEFDFHPSQSRALAREWALVAIIAEVARPGTGTSPGRAPPGALPRAADASAAS